MGAPAFTEPELRRVLTVAREFGASVEICPRKGTIRILASDPPEPVDPARGDTDEDQCDAAFGMM
jgi:hypothetical protein